MGTKMLSSDEWFENVIHSVSRVYRPTNIHMLMGAHTNSDTGSCLKNKHCFFLFLSVE